MLRLIIAVGIGGFFGAISRFVIAGWVQKLTGASFPWGTLTVNVLGSFIIGILAILFERFVNPELKAMMITGFLGALTTFSSFSYETVSLFNEGLFFQGAANIALNVVFCITATVVAMSLTSAVLGA